MKKIIVITAILLSFSLLLQGQIVHVPGDQSTIQDAIVVANDGDTVLVDTGTYYENINFIGKAITVASYYLIEKDSTYIYNTIIDGSQPMHPDSASVVRFMSGEDSTSVIYGFTLTAGSGTKFPEQVGFEGVLAGGGVGIINCGAKISHNIITNNTVENEAEAFGAGIAGGLCTEDKWVVVEHNLIKNNTAISNNWPKGGGMAIAYINSRISNNTIIHNTVSANSSTRVAAAGGIWYSCDSGFPDSLIISGNIIQHNLVEQESANSDGTAGSGLCIYGDYGQTTRALITNNVISDNEILAVDIAFGCGVALVNCHSVDFSYNEIYNNTFESDFCFGGGLTVWNTHPNVSRNLIYNNKATRGGGIYVGHQITSQPVFFNNSIYGNEGTQSGGGLYLRNAACTITNEIMWNNTAPGTPGIYIYSGSTVDVNYSLVEEWTGPGNGNLDEDPLFFDPEFGDFHLTQNSPCINTGDPNSPPDPDGSICDMGVFYYDQRPILALPATDTTVSSFGANWEEAEDALGYLLDIATDPDFNNYVEGLQNLDVGNVVSYFVEGLEPNSGYHYRIRAYYSFGRSGYSNVIIVSTLTSITDIQYISSPLKVFPNPFGNTATIEYEITNPGNVKIAFFNHLGQQVESIDHGNLQTGKHQYIWNARDLPAGLFFVQIRVGKTVTVQKIIKVP